AHGKIGENRTRDALLQDTGKHRHGHGQEQLSGWLKTRKQRSVKDKLAHRHLEVPDVGRPLEALDFNRDFLCSLLAAIKRSVPRSTKTFAGMIVLVSMHPTSSRARSAARSGCRRRRFRRDEQGGR